MEGVVLCWCIGSVSAVNRCCVRWAEQRVQLASSNEATELREKRATAVGTLAQQLLERCIQGEMPMLGCVHVLVRRVRPWKLAICGHVERNVKRRLEIVLQRVKMTEEKETMGIGRASLWRAGSDV